MHQGGGISIVSISIGRCGVEAHGTEEPSCGLSPSGTWGLFLLPKKELRAGKQLQLIPAAALGYHPAPGARPALALCSGHQRVEIKTKFPLP